MTAWLIFLALAWMAGALLSGIGIVVLGYIVLTRIAKHPPACPTCEGKGWRQMIHLSGEPDTETCPTCRNPDRNPCPWRLP